MAFSALCNIKSCQARGGGEGGGGGGGVVRDRGLIYFDFTKGAFFWDYSGIGILGIDGICVLLGIIPFSE